MKTQHGTILLQTLLTVAIIGIFSITLVEIAQLEIRISHNNQQKNQNFIQAERALSPRRAMVGQS